MANTGYWMPFEAAQAMATTFCWDIRYALTPIFGPLFPQTCLQPKAEGYKSMVIDPSIIQRCTERAAYYRELEITSVLETRSLVRTQCAPGTPMSRRRNKRLRPHARHFHSESGYNSDTSLEDSSLSLPTSPTSAIYSNWTTASTPRSTGPNFNDRLWSPVDGASTAVAEAEDADHCPHYTDKASPKSSSSSLPLVDSSPREILRDIGHSDGPEDIAAGTASPFLDEAQVGRPGSEIPVLSEKKAAYLLMTLRSDNVSRQPTIPKGEKRRSST
jgi:hypothetical protein